MATEVLDLPVIERGDTVPYVMHWRSNQTPLDMQGKSVILTLKLSPVLEDKDASITKTLNLPMNDPLAQAGETTITLEHSETATLIPGQTYHMAVRVIEPGIPNAVETTYFYGRVPVKDS